MHDFQSIIDTLSLEPHPEGGFYKEMHRSEITVKGFIDPSNKCAHTSIYYLLSGNDFSAWHRIKSDETWYFHLGCDLLIYFFDEDELLRTIQMGVASKNLQATIPANTWFAAKPLNENAYCLVSCAVAPGFEFDDFEIAMRGDLLNQFGNTTKSIQMIKALTRE